MFWAENDTTHTGGSLSLARRWEPIHQTIGRFGRTDPTHYREARNEIPILYHDGERDVDGVIDRLILRDDEIVVIDYKTHARATKENIAQLAENFREQMRQYGEGARRLWPGKKLRLLLLFTACGSLVELPP